jgi:queuine tRNA-ribosyltransferase
MTESMLTIRKNIKKKRLGTVKTKNGEIKTPFFMPDATYGFVRSLGKNDLKKIGVDPMVINTYHLYLQPGTNLIKKAKNIHGFMNWNRPLLSDSGGYQVFSLVHKNPEMGKITDDGVIFRSPLDGSKHVITPEKSIQIQFDLGVDMMVCFDDPPPNSSSKEKIAKAVDRTLAWAERCMIEYKKQIKARKIKKEKRPLIFCVIQGGEYLDLRKKCVEELTKIGFSTQGGPALGWDGYGFGARHLDAEGNFMEEVLRFTADLIPENALRFALGIGTPEDIVRCANMGWDMFDCVIPTREGRHGKLFIRKNNFQNLKGKFYETININNEKYKEDFSAVDKHCDCELCQNYSRSYLRYLFAKKEPLAMRLAAMHNLKFYMDLMQKLRK